MTVAIFGASVTQQKNGYAAILKKELTDKVEVFGYGGMHLNDAGVSYVDEIIQANPSICFIDWFSTSYIESTTLTLDYIDAIIFKLSQHGIKIIFLFLLHKHYLEREKFKKFVKKNLIEKKVQYIDMEDYVEVGKSRFFLRDDVHTNEKGSRLYATLIHNEYKKRIASLQVLNSVKSNKYCYIKKLSVGKSFEKILHLSGTCEIIGFELTIGPHSGKIFVRNNKMLIMEENTYDQWCYFNRQHFNLKRLFCKDALTLEIIQDRYENKKKLVIHSVYYIGESLQINNLFDGKNIYEIFFKISNLISKTKSKFIK